MAISKDYTVQNSPATAWRNAETNIWERTLLTPDYYTAPTINLSVGNSGARAALQASQNAANNALGSMGKATSAITSGLDPVNQALEQARLAADRANESANAIGGVAASMSPAIGNVGNAAEGMRPIIANVGDAANAMGRDIANVRRTAENLYPYANELQRYANDLWTRGINLGDQGQGFIAQGNNLINLNANAGGLVGEIVKSLGMIDPNAYVSMGAADVQNSFNNAQQQMIRNLTRAGSDASSLKTAASQTQFATSLAAALAGAKTRLRVQGIKDRFAALGTALQSAESMVKQGVDTMQTALGYQAQASENQADAGNIIAKMGDLYATAGGLQGKQGDVYAMQGKLQEEMGGLYATQGDLLGKQGNLYAQQSSARVSVGNLINNIAGLDIKSAEMLMDAYKNEAAAYNAVSSAQADAAKYYARENDMALQVAKANADLQAKTNAINAGLQETWLRNGNRNVISNMKIGTTGGTPKRNL